MKTKPAQYFAVGPTPRQGKGPAEDLVLPSPLTTDGSAAKRGGAPDLVPGRLGADNTLFSHAAFTDAGDFGGAFGASCSRCLQLAPGRFGGTIERLSLAAAVITLADVNRLAHLEIRTSPNMLGICLFLKPHTFYRWMGEPMAPEEAALLLPGTDVDLVLGGPVALLQVDRLALTMFGGNIHSRSGEDLLAAENQVKLRLDRTVFSRLRDFVEMMCSSCRGGENSGKNNIERNQPLRRECLLILVGALLSALPVRRQQISAKRYHWVKQIEDYTRRHIEDQPALDQLIEAARVNDCALRTAFRSVRGIDPQTYLLAVRLNHARSLFRFSALDQEDAQAIAGRLGFADLDSFGRSYRLMFEESPEQTIWQSVNTRRAPQFQASDHSLFADQREITFRYRRR